MSYNEVIKKGISFLKANQNTDGGIPIGKIGDESGYWTTAESLEAMLSTDYFQLSADNLQFIIKMVKYILDGFVECDVGGFWEGKRGSGASTMTTGHVIYSLTLFLNKFLDHDMEVIIENGKLRIRFASLIKEIREVISKATLWMHATQNKDDGWGPNEHSKSNIVCCYYVLKGLAAVGRNSETDNNVYSACILIKKNIQSILKKKNRDLDANDFAYLLYGYMSLKLSIFFRKYDREFEIRINNFIQKKWKKLQQDSTSKELASASNSFLNNLPWILLNTLMQSENYTYSKKISILLEKYIDQQSPDGSWYVIKNGQKETTWITAEIVVDLNLAQTRFIKYRNDIIYKKQYQMVMLMNIILGLLCFFRLLPIRGVAL